MASSAKAVGYGTTVAFTTNTTLNGLKVRDISWSGAEEDIIAVPDYATADENGTTEVGNVDKIAVGLRDGGIVTVEYYFNPDILLVRGSDTVTITWAEGATWIFTALIVWNSATMPMRDVMTISCDLHVSGDIARTAAA